MTKRFRSVLVANRGEIAVRILRGARALGYETVAVYSDADRHALHVREAHRAVYIGPAPAAESYLSIPRLIAAAKEAGADAVHPGYGFLSERAAFARALADACLVFIGPDASSIEAMGNKSAAKARMTAAGVPCVPGLEGDDRTDAAFIEAAQAIGFPVMVKAAAGGGGRGMRLVQDAAALSENLRAARSEAQSAFGSGELLLEKAVTGARHVEIQIFGDRHGNVVHFGERDCSVQRRNQKVVEEAPSPAVDEALRATMGAAAVRAAKVVNYVGAGTVEFLLDRDGHFYFLEMNTRLQVEHAVTEMVYGVDLVAWQLLVAQGESLPLSQDEITNRRHGHAIEVRLCTEDPAKGYLPQTGTVLQWLVPPDRGRAVRVDTHLETGTIIGPFYDSMQAKIIAHGANRDAARAILLDALADTTLFGVTSNRDFLARIIASDAFGADDVATDFLARNGSLLGPDASTREKHRVERLALAAVTLLADDGLRLAQEHGFDETDLLGWQSALPMATPLVLSSDGIETTVSVIPLDRASYRVTLGDGHALDVHAVETAGTSVRYTQGTVRKTARFGRAGDTLWLDANGEIATYVDRTYRPAETTEGADGIVRATMDGKIVRTAVAPGETVAKGDVLVVVEAMKLELELTATIAGTVAEIGVRAGEQVATGQVLARIDAP
ncbi:MAG TPA: biotin carboxylase N-terminal domain-containing protein [Polyangiaceae bacterium]|nr:biotin carboxylase N-terminal domain-containing protein [Polyangiaceae bacterium]